MLTTCLMACVLAAAPLRASVPQTVAVLFSSDAAGPVWTLRASLAATPLQGREVAYRYHAEVWLGAPNSAGDDAEAQPEIGGRRLHSSAQFKSLPPLDGWPERDELGISWHPDGGIEVRLGAALRLETEACAPSRWQALEVEHSTFAVVAATLIAAGERRAGYAVVEMGSGRQAAALTRPGTLLVVGALETGVVMRVGGASTWLAAAPDAPARQMEPAYGIVWVDGVREASGFVPTALRLERGTEGLLLERADAFWQGRGPEVQSAALPSVLVPLIGAGFADERPLRAVGLLVPPVELQAPQATSSPAR